MKLYKINIMIIAIALLAIVCTNQKVQAISSPYLSLKCEDDIVTNDNAIINASINGAYVNFGKSDSAEFEITVSKNQKEVVKYRKKVNADLAVCVVTFNIFVDTNTKLEAGVCYDYQISVVTNDDVNKSMYTAKHHFTTSSVAVSVVSKEEQYDNAIIKAQVDNKKGELIKKVGLKLLVNDKVVKEYSKEVNTKNSMFESVFNVKADSGYKLQKNTKYDYILYAESDVSQSYLYTSQSVCNGYFETLGKTSISSWVKPSRKKVKFTVRINNPNLKKIAKVKVIVKKGKKKLVVYNKKINSKYKNVKNAKVVFSVKKTRLYKKLGKSSKYKYEVYVSVGKNKYKSKGKIKIK